MVSKSCRENNIFIFNFSKLKQKNGEYKEN